jgi:hypothetical protein
VVLVPPGGPASPRLFRSWTAIYDEVLLARTCRLLASRDVIAIPGDVLRPRRRLARPHGEANQRAPRTYDSKIK